MVVFTSRGAISIRENIFFQTGDSTGDYSGCGLKYKHASPDPTSTFEVSDCYFQNHKYFAIGIGTANAHIHHNVINGASFAFNSQDHGGPTHQNDEIFERNTVYGGPAFYMSPTLAYVNDDGGPWPGLKNIVFRNNVVYDRSNAYGKDLQMVLLNSYMSNELFLALRPALSFGGNCYFNPLADLSFGFAGATTGYGDLGSYHDFNSWQTTYDYDLDSLVADPLFVDPESLDFSLAATSPCAGLGAIVDGHRPPTDPNAIFRCQPR